MNRRRFLGFLAGTTAALATTRAASAQSRPTGRWAPSDVPPAAPVPRPTSLGLGGSVPGVTATEVRIGMSAALKGTAGGLGTELYRGAQAYYDEVNLRGGVHGRAISVVALDDNYEPNPCIRNTIQLLEKDPVFTLSNYVGTPTLTRALPVIKRYAEQQVVLVGNFTGAQPQREAPYADQVFNIRASYRQEMMALVERFWALGARSFGVYYQIDAYGRSGTDGVARGLAQHGARITAEATYPRGAKFTDDMTPAVQALQKAGVDVVLCTGAYQGCGAFVRSARDAGFLAPISNVSFVGSDAMLKLLVQHGKTNGRDYTRALVNSQVVPAYDDLTLPPGRAGGAARPELRRPAGELHQPRGVRERQGPGGGAAPRGPAAHARVVPAGPGIAAQFRSRNRRGTDLRAREAPGSRLRLLHARRG